jgi:hypothetical protein
METQKCQQVWSNTTKPTTTKPLFQQTSNLGHHYGNTKISTVLVKYNKTNHNKNTLPANLKQIETGGNLGHHYGNTKMSTGFRQSNHSNI